MCYQATSQAHPHLPWEGTATVYALPPKACCALILSSNLHHFINKGETVSHHCKAVHLHDPRRQFWLKEQVQNNWYTRAAKIRCEVELIRCNGSKMLTPPPLLWELILLSCVHDSVKWRTFAIKLQSNYLKSLPEDLALFRVFAKTSGLFLFPGKRHQLGSSYFSVFGENRTPFFPFTLFPTS